MQMQNKRQEKFYVRGNGEQRGEKIKTESTLGNAVSDWVGNKASVIWKRCGTRGCLKYWAA